MRQEILEGIRRHVQSLKGWSMSRSRKSRHAKIAWDVHPSALNLYGNLHGGLIFALCDMAAGMATYAYEVSNVAQQGCITYQKRELRKLYAGGRGAQGPDRHPPRWGHHPEGKWRRTPPYHVPLDPV